MRVLGPSPRRSTTKTFDITAQNDAPRQGRSMTLSSSGSNWSLNQAQRLMMTGLQDTVQEYLKAPPANTLPRPEFPTAGPSQSSLSIRLEEGMHQMSEVITGMSEAVLSDQRSQEGPTRSVWRTLKEGGIVTSNHPWTEYWFNGKVRFGHPNVPTL